jgi:hypothetical protein
MDMTKAKEILKNKWVWAGGAAALGLVLWLKFRGGPSTGQEISVTLGFTPAAVASNELVSANKYRLIERRSGMSYVPVTSGSLGGTLEFKSPSSGKFTWNVIQEGGQLYAEVAA